MNVDIDADVGLSAGDTEGEASAFWSNPFKSEHNALVAGKFATVLSNYLLRDSVNLLGFAIAIGTFVNE